MTKTQAWIHAFRLRTLPLALSSIVMGAFVAYADNGFRAIITGLAALTTLFLQILSNLANDYGDSKHGVDNVERLGPERAVQSGVISAKEMKYAVILFSVLSFVSGIALLISGLGSRVFSIRFLVFLILGISAIAAAVKYTVGKNPYGYKGFGDVFVFLFFGLAGVIGTYFLNTGVFKWDVILPAISIGCLSTGVLNLNNMRDIDNDRESGKITLVVKMGEQKARIYHLLLIVITALSSLLYTAINYSSLWQYLYIIIFILFYKHIKTVLSTQQPQQLDPYLKQLAIATLLFSFAYGICQSI